MDALVQLRGDLEEVREDYRSCLADWERMAQRRDAAEAYAKEGWYWVDEALAALGVKTVFEIPRRKERSISFVDEGELAKGSHD
jgi:hypothetical protein